MALAAPCWPDHENFHALGREIENFWELFMHVTIELHGGPIGNLDHNLFRYGLQLSKSFECQPAHHFKRDRLAHVNPVALFAGLPVFPLGEIRLRLTRSQVANHSEGLWLILSDLPSQHL